MHNIEGCERANDGDALRSGQENPVEFPGMGIRRSTEQQLKEMIYILADIFNVLATCAGWNLPILQLRLDMQTHM